MKKILLIVLSLSWVLRVSGQNVGEVFINGKNVSHEICLNGLMQDSSKFSFFNYTRFSVSNKDNRLNEFLSNSTISYDLGRVFGLVGGGHAINIGISNWSSSFHSITYININRISIHEKIYLHFSRSSRPARNRTRCSNQRISFDDYSTFLCA